MCERGDDGNNGLANPFIASVYERVSFVWNKVGESGCGAMFTPKGPYPTERTDIGSFG